MRYAPPIVFDPATLNLKGWWRAPFVASPWVGVASVGTSGSNNLTEATNPPTIGEPQTTYAGPLFDGTNDLLGGAALSTYLSTSFFSVAMLIKVTSTAVNNTAGAGEILSDTTGSLSIGTYTVGSQAYLTVQTNTTTAGWYSSSAHPIELDTWHMIAFTFNSAGGVYTSFGHASANMSTDSAPAGSSSAGAYADIGDLTSVAGTLRVGASKASFGRFFDGQIQELLLSTSANLVGLGSGGNASNLFEYFKARYSF